MKKNKKIIWSLIILLISIIGFAVSCYRLEPDYFWHLKAGDYMFHHGILTKDIFSWYVKGKYWMSHEWLFEIIIYTLKYLFGNFHILIYCSSCLLFIFSVIFLVNKEDIFKNISYSLLFIILYGMLLSFYVQARPHLLSYCLFTLTIWFLIDLYHNKDSKKIYFLPFITVLWANCHGGSSNLPYLLCFLFFIGGLFTFQFSKIEAQKLQPLQLKKYLIMAFLCMIAVCINIHGFKMFIYPYQNMLDKTMLSNISEWQVTNLNEWSHLIYYMFLLFVLGTFLLSAKKIHFIDFLLTNFIIYLGLKSIRFWQLGPIALSFILFDYVEEVKPDKITYIASLLFSTFFLCYLVGSIPKVCKSPTYLELNDEIIRILKAEKPQKFFNNYDYGGELIYHDIPVFVDGRADLYSQHNFKDYLTISRLESGAIYFIHQYDFDYFLVDSSLPLYNYLEYSGEYEKIYFSGTTYLYKKIVN